MAVPSNAVQTQGLNTVSADEVNTYVQFCTTAAQLRTFSGLEFMSVYLQGINLVNDGLGGLFYWNAAGTEPDDNLNFIQPPGSAGQWWRGTIFAPGFSTPYDFGFYVPGTLSASQVIAEFVMARQVSYAQNFAPSRAVANSLPTGSPVVNVTHNGTVIGTITWTPSSGPGVFSGAAITYLPGDLLGFVAPASVDATLGNLSITMAGVQT